MIVDLKQLALTKNDYGKFKLLLKRKHNIKSSTFWLAWVGLLLGLACCMINIWNILLPENANLSVYGAVWSKLLFNFFGYFTQQSNIIVIFAYFLFLTCFRTKIFNNRNLLVAVGIYINTTMITYWLVMFPEWVMGTLSTYSWWSIFSTLAFHLFCPIIYDLFLLINVNYPYKKIKNPMNRIHTKHFVIYVLIYTVIYAIFAVMINFIRLPVSAFRTDVRDLDGNLVNLMIEHHPYASIYNIITNFNQQCWNIVYFNPLHPDLGVCFDVNSKGQIFYILLVFPVGIILAANFIWIIWVNNHKSTPNSMRIDVLRESVMINEEDKKIYRKHLMNFEKLIWISSKKSKKKNNTKKGKKNGK